MPTPAELATELQTDPNTLGYTTPLAAEDWIAVANLINAKNPATLLPAGVVASYEIIGAINRVEYNALSAAEKTYLDFLVQGGFVDTTAAEIRTALSGVFGGGTTSRTNLLALADRDASRAEVLWGRDTTISYLDIIIAIRGAI